MSRSFFSRSFLVRGSFSVLSLLSLTACPPIEFEPDGSAGARSASGGAAGSNTGALGGAAGNDVNASGGTAGTTRAPVMNLQLTRSGGLGFCGKELDALDLKLSRKPDGLMSVEGTYLTLEPNVDGLSMNCNDSGECVVPVAIEPYALNAVQQAQLDGLVAALPVGECIESPNLACDTCLVSTLKLDGRTETSYCCGERRAAGFYEALGSIEDFLDSLIRPRSSAESFRLRRGPGMGFCANPGQAQEASFTRDLDGGLTMSGKLVQVLLERPAGACPAGTERFVDQACLSAVPATKLTAEQQARLEQLLGALPEGQCQLDPLLACDPCLTTSYQLDSRTESGECCGKQVAPGYEQAFVAIGRYVDSLMPALATRNDSIRFIRSTAIALCVDEGAALDVTLNRGQDGAFALVGTYAARPIQPDEHCPDGTQKSDIGPLCIGTLNSSVLTATETAEIDTRIAALPAGQCEEATGQMCDVCVSSQLEFGSRSETTYCCGTQRTVGFDAAFETISAYIDALVRQRQNL